MSVASDIKKATLKVDDALGKVIRGTALDLFSAIDADTPVLEGRLRGNNQLTLDKATTTQLERKDKSGQLSVGEAARILNRHRLLQDIYISNPLDYAVFVEESQSFFQKNVGLFEDQIKANAKKHRIK